MMGSARWHYDGTRERALMRIKDSAFRLGGNSVQLDKVPEYEYLGLDGAQGSIVVLTGNALKC